MIKFLCPQFLAIIENDTYGDNSIQYSSCMAPIQPLNFFEMIYQPDSFFSRLIHTAHFFVQYTLQ